MSWTKHNNLETPDQGTKSWDAIVNENMNLLEQGFTIKGTAGATITSGKVVYEDSDKKFKLAIANAGDTVSRFVGFTTADVDFNTETYVRHIGYISDPNWSFVPGPVYLSDSVAGNVTQTAPYDRRLVAFAIQTNEILIRPWLEPEPYSSHSHNIIHDHAGASSGGATLTSPTIVTPTIASFTNATHNHSNAAGGGVIDIPTNVPYIRLHDSKATTVAGGTFTSGAWQKRVIIEDQDTNNKCSVTDSEITLEAGTYACLIVCPANVVGDHQARLRNTTDGVTTLLSYNAYSYAAGNAGCPAIMQGRFVITTQKTFEIQHRCTVTVSTNGFGKANSFGENEIYTVAEFWKVA